MKIQIHGAGISGSYLYFLLRDEFDVGIDDVRAYPDCRCGWGITYKEAKKLYKGISINFDEYILSKPRYVITDSLKIKNRNIVTFDRARLLSELWKELEFKKIESKLEVDATGFKRAYLPRIKNDKIYSAIQTIERHEVDENIYAFGSKTGYAWAFPLGDGKWHIGAGDVTLERAKLLVEYLRKIYGFEEKGFECSCRAYIRFLPPSKCLPFMNGNVIGIGEAIGCISGFGEGNTPSLFSAKILRDCLINSNLEDYEMRILKEFKWIEIEHKFIEAIQEGKIFKFLLYLLKVASIEKKRTLNYSFRDVLSIIVNQIFRGIMR